MNEKTYTLDELFELKKNNKSVDGLISIKDKIIGVEKFNLDKVSIINISIEKNMISLYKDGNYRIFEKTSNWQEIPCWSGNTIVSTVENCKDKQEAFNNPINLDDLFNILSKKEPLSKIYFLKEIDIFISKDNVKFFNNRIYIIICKNLIKSSNGNEYDYGLIFEKKDGKWYESPFLG